MPGGRQALRVLCFGDSLTAGTPSGNSYSHCMARMVQMAMRDTEVHTEVDGEPDATVLHRFGPRIRRQFLADEAPTTLSSSALSSSSSSSSLSFAAAVAAAAAAGGGGGGGGGGAPVTLLAPPFDWTIVLGGTNDLALGHDPEQIFQVLKDVWEIPLSNNTRVLALTVPEIAMPDAEAEWREELDAARDKLNSLIRGYERENFYVYDLHDAMRYFAMPPHDRDRYWNDIVHFTSQGYDMMGEKIGVALVHILIKEKIKCESQRQQEQEQEQRQQQQQQQDRQHQQPPAAAIHHITAGDGEPGGCYDGCAGPSVINKEYVVVQHEVE